MTIEMRTLAAESAANLCTTDMTTSQTVDAEGTGQAFTPLFLGLDSSTQALKASLLSPTLEVVAELEVRFDSDLPHFGTKGGVLHGPQGSGEVFSPVLQPVEAIDLLLERIKAAGWDVGRVRGVAAAGQQHASVYWSGQAKRMLAELDPSRSMAEQLSGAFSRDVIPNWQDSSTVAECEAITAGVGGPSTLARVTGSSAHTRFTGSQIMRFRRLFPDAYANTERISLVSSFITTLLCADGDIKGIDESDACGMNMWDMSRAERGWNETILDIIAGDAPGGGAELAEKLGTVETDGGKVVGRIGNWFRQRYGFSPECAVFPGTGDNPATFLSLVLRESEGLISMGTSDVVLVSTAAYNPHEEYHAFFHPAQIAPPSSQDVDARQEHEDMRYFNMLVYKNGSLAREHVRDLYFEKSWDAFNAAVEKKRPKSVHDVPRNTAFWWLLPDIIPAGAFGVHKYTSPTSSSVDVTPVREFADKDDEALAILESQLLNYRSRSAAILRSDPGTLMPETPSSAPHLSRVYATGGASANPTILSLMADVMACPVSKNVEFDPATGEWSDAHWNACSVGVAYKARWGWERATAKEAQRKWIGFDEFIGECREERKKQRGRVGKVDGLEEEGIRNVALPGEGSAAYDGIVERWRALEARALQEGKQSRS